MFRLLWWIFNPSLEVTTADKMTGLPAAYRVRNVSYHHDNGGRYMIFWLRAWRWTGLKFEKYDDSRIMREFDVSSRWSLSADDRMFALFLSLPLHH